MSHHYDGGKVLSSNSSQTALETQKAEQTKVNKTPAPSVTGYGLN